MPERTQRVARPEGLSDPPDCADASVTATTPVTELGPRLLYPIAPALPRRTDPPPPRRPLRAATKGTRDERH